MEDRAVPEEIEFVMTPDVDDEVEFDGADQSPRATPIPRRFLAAAAIVAMFALLVGWLIGDAGGSGVVAPTAATDAVTTTMAEEARGEPLPPVTTRPVRTTTTTTTIPHRRVVEAVGLDPRLVGTELTLIGLERRDSHMDLIELDLVDQTLTHRHVGPHYGVESIAIVDDSVLLLGPNDRAQLIRDDEPPQTWLAGDPWSVLWEDGSSRLWRPDWESGGWHGPTVYEEIDLLGEPTGSTIDLPAGTWAERVDPRGGLIVFAAGKSYSVDETGVSPIGAGDLLGVSSALAVRWDCDDQLRCGVYVTDRGTGDVRVLDLDITDDEVIALESPFVWGGGAGPAISPDDEACAVMLISDPNPRLGLVDLRSGALVELGDVMWVPTVVWSPDARFAFFLEYPFDGNGHGELRAYDRASGELFSVFAEGREWTALTGRPAAV